MILEPASPKVVGVKMGQNRFPVNERPPFTATRGASRPRMERDRAYGQRIMPAACGATMRRPVCGTLALSEL